jgi:hypothetical protein
MRDVLLQLALTSNGRTATYDSSGGGTPDYVLVDDHGRGKLDPADAPHLRYAREWDAAGDAQERARVLEAAQKTLEHIRHSHADRGADESREDRDRRIVKDGRGWSAADVAIAFRCGITDVYRARTAQGLDAERGEEIINGRALSRTQRNIEIRRLRAQGMNPFQIARKLGLPDQTVRDVLARPPAD